VSVSTLLRRLSARLGTTDLGKEVDTNGGLIHVVKRVVHEPGDKGRLPD
jgi:hypothetical protein